MPPAGERFATLVAELKRRRVIRVAVAYAVAAYAVVQAASTFFPPLHVPDRVLTVVAVMAILGFVPAVVLAWAFDWTSSGIKRTDAAALTDAAPRRGGRAFWFVLGGTVVLLGAWWVGARPRRPAAADANIVAVLPFRVSAANPSLGYLREGMLDLLAAKLTGDGAPRAVTRVPC